MSIYLHVVGVALGKVTLEVHAQRHMLPKPRREETINLVGGSS
jgi:hypothetical protein